MDLSNLMITIALSRFTHPPDDDACGRIAENDPGTYPDYAIWQMRAASAAGTMWPMGVETEARPGSGVPVERVKPLRPLHH
ncbi:hypothetical protein NITHO_4240012 [Nitrolancea hollandica Lb]|uniref:Uncharacterized protein n=1 Tax=Nitrolancea hollandica Lb TaxID=1129897 RepID=I4EJU7_9BACT|nr:hypothetical protein NITHO_4240012 [Nitrolancea hollandica Lb]